ncbi:MAG TPA: DUF4153 domain-containing protein [Gemmatimonadales bacterium]|nr:DUF4153 domain-containing protein [Gemmatimonadales bacterium]
MRFPSLSHLLDRARAALRRFPWTLLAGTVAAAAAIAASNASGAAEDRWARIALVAALGLPLTVGLGLLAEVRRWRPTATAAAQLAGGVALAGFFAAWPGVQAPHHAIRYVQLSAVLHLAVSFLPFMGAGETPAFWQYNRRLFLGFLRSAVFSGVLFVGVAIALAALDKLFGVHIGEHTYFQLWAILAFVVNTWIFLDSVPADLRALPAEAEYPRALKLFAQYVLTPLSFTYLVILLAYLVKILLGGEWPSGWIGWLVASVSVTGLLGFLLVHPLRRDPAEGWIRIYSRWLFVGLVPAALMLLVAFWKRIEPYGLTEPRALGVALGIWLLGIALWYAARRDAGIRTIPVTLAAVLLITLWGPLGLTQLAVASQGRRLARTLAAGDDAEASAALRFLLDRRAGAAIAAGIGRELPPVAWDTVPRHGEQRDSLATRIMVVAGKRYVPQWSHVPEDGPFSIGGGSGAPLAVAGYAWAVPISREDTSPRLVGADSVAVLPSADDGVARIRIGVDTLSFDLARLARRHAEAAAVPTGGVGERLVLTPDGGSRRAVLALGRLSGERREAEVRVTHWSGWLLLEGNTTGR